MDVKTLITLAKEFGLSCVERRDEITIIGEKQNLVFRVLNTFNNQVEEQQCQLKEIY